MPATLASGSSVGPITVSYTQPPSGTSTVTATSQFLDAGSESGQQHRQRRDHRSGDGRSRQQAVNFPASVYAGQPVSGTVLYTNNGPSSASGVTFALTLSANLAAAPT
jgi:uncharacterized repeat protein (TIGR01451 family)